METLNLQPLEFGGKSSKECEKFISAVLKHAFAQSKQRDDAWIADFVATCLDEDALRWWIALDEETQGSWRLLRRAMAQEYQPLYRVSTSEEVEGFIRMVYRRAREAGKQGDNRWIMELVPTCLSGDALRWYATLDRRIRTDWDSFQQAAFGRYAVTRQDSISSDGSGSSIEPSPVTATPTPVTEEPIASLLHDRQRGRIRLARDLDPAQYYISKKLTAGSFFYVTKSLDEALEVEYDCTPEDHKQLYIPQNQVRGFDAIGIVWYDSHLGDPTSLAAVVPVNSKTNKWTDRSHVFKGPVFTKVWRVDSRPSDSEDGRLSLVSQNGDLFPMSGGHGGNVLVYTTPRQRSSVSLTFEAI